MSTIELDPTILHGLPEDEWRLLALAGEAPLLESPLPWAAYGSALSRELPLPGLLAVGCAAPEAGDADPASFEEWVISPAVCDGRPATAEIARLRDHRFGAIG
jgi:hypothetical protein